MEVLAPLYSPATAAADARRLADAGVAGAFTFEGPHDVFLPLALAAAAVPDLALMTNVAIAFPRNAVHLAHAAWDLHQLCGGRFTLGMGTQVRAHVERRFGVGFDHPVDRMRDTVEAVRAVFAAWQEGRPLDHRGPYRHHTLMTPMFSPAPSTVGVPAVAVGGLGPRMCALAAEAADALAVMPVTSERFFTERTLPAVAAGSARRVAGREPVEVLPELIVACGRDAAEQDLADAGCRALLGFYASTPAYLPVLEAEGHGRVHERARALVREGRWDDVAALVPDDLLGAVCVRGTPDEVAAEVARRYAAHASRVCVYLPYDAPPDLWAALVAALNRC